MQWNMAQNCVYLEKGNIGFGSDGDNCNEMGGSPRSSKQNSTNGSKCIVEIEKSE